MHMSAAADILKLVRGKCGYRMPLRPLIPSLCPLQHKVSRFPRVLHSVCYEQALLCGTCSEELASLSSVLLPLPVRDCATTDLFQQFSIRLHNAHTGSILPTTLRGKSPCSVTEESIIRRLQHTNSWTDSEAECPDAVCLACSQSRCGESPHVSCRECHQKITEHQFCQTLKQSSELQSAFVFFATTQSFRERSLESVICFSGFPGFLDFSSSEKFKTSPLVPAHPS